MAERVAAAPMPILPTGINKETGFTMVELLVVLAVMAIISGAVIIAMGPALRDARLRTGCRTIMAALNYARSHAVTERTDTRVIFANDGNGVHVEEITADDRGEDVIRPVTTPAGRFHRLPDNVTMLVVKNSSVNENWIRFTELGQAENALIRIDDNYGRTWTVVVDAITGRGEVLQAEDEE
jgi:type II secretion system protein H